MSFERTHRCAYGVLVTILVSRKIKYFLQCFSAFLSFLYDFHSKTNWYWTSESVIEIFICEIQLLMFLYLFASGYPYLAHLSLLLPPYAQFFYCHLSSRTNSQLFNKLLVSKQPFLLIGFLSLEKKMFYFFDSL